MSCPEECHSRTPRSNPLKAGLRLAAYSCVMDTNPIQRSRGIEALVAGTPTSDGAGVKLSRVLTQQWQRRLDPFLMLDHFGSESPDDYIAGLPDHPHRGFETVTIMLQGRMRHRDSGGHEGLITDGGVQWMTAASGLIHSETPEQTEGRMDGFQLWLNLHSADKMGPIGYRDIEDRKIPPLQGPGGKVRVGAVGGGRDVAVGGGGPLRGGRRAGAEGRLMRRGGPGGAAGRFGRGRGARGVWRRGAAERFLLCRRRPRAGALRFVVSRPPA